MGETESILAFKDRFGGSLESTLGPFKKRDVAIFLPVDVLVAAAADAARAHESGQAVVPVPSESPAPNVCYRVRGGALREPASTSAPDEVYLCALREIGVGEVILAGFPRAWGGVRKGGDAGSGAAAAVHLVPPLVDDTTSRIAQPVAAADRPPRTAHHGDAAQPSGRSGPLSPRIDCLLKIPSARAVGGGVRCQPLSQGEDFALEV